MLTTLLSDHRGYGDHDGGGFFFLLFLVLIGVGIFFGVRAIIRRRRGDELDRTGATRLLDERFARGDIDRAEYEHRKAVLDGAAVVPPAPVTASQVPMAAPPAAAPTATATMDASASDVTPADTTADDADPTASSNADQTDSSDAAESPESADDDRPG